MAVAGIPLLFALSLSPLFKDGMVLQRNVSVPVCGTAAAGERVKVEFAGQVREATADSKGVWRVDLAPMPASCEPRTLTITSQAPEPSNSLTVADAVVGEVWLASGQSNMEYRLADDEGRPLYEDLQRAYVEALDRDPLLRFANVSSYRRADVPTNDVAVVWYGTAAGSLRKAKMSAVAYYYARELRRRLDVPVGVVGVWWGGTAIEPWLPGGKIWNAQVAPLAPFAAKGVIWYQGEANVGRAKEYPARMHELYDGWSREFGIADMSFYFVQIAPFVHYRDKEAMCELMEAQAKFAAEERHAAMVVSADLGNLTHIHPYDKEPVALRLARHALRRDYGFAVPDESPSLREWRVDGDVVELVFDHLAAAHVFYGSGMWTEGCGEPDFEIAGADGVWHNAEVLDLHLESETRGVKYFEGRIDGGNVLRVRSKDVKAPVKLRYLHRSPWNRVFYNEAGLPCGPFQIANSGDKP